MKVDFSQRIRGLNGEPAVNESDGTPVTLGVLARESLMVKDPESTGEEKVLRLELALKIGKTTKFALESSEIQRIKTCANLRYSEPLLVGQLWKLMEGKKGIPEMKKEVGENGTVQ